MSEARKTVNLDAEANPASDTDSPTLERYLQGIQDMPKPQRFVRALELSALARSLTWQGANRHAGHLGPQAVVTRYLLQMYGTEVAERVTAARADAEDE